MPGGRVANPLHGVESVSLFGAVGYCLGVVNPLHGVESYYVSDCAR